MILPLVVLGCLNLLFSTSWGTGILERRIEAKAGIANEIGSVTWSPWAGVTVKEFRILPVEGGSGERDLCQIEEISVNPSWISLLNGKKRWDKLEIQGFDGSISIEQIKVIVSRFQEKQERPPTVSLPDLSKDDEVPEDGIPQVSPPTETKTDPPLAGKSNPGDPDGSEDQSHEILAPEDDFEGLVILKNCHFQVYSEEVPDLRIDIRDVNGELPVWGGDRPGGLRIGKLDLGDRFIENNLEIICTWKQGVLGIDNHEMSIFGMDLRLTGVLRLVSGLPVGLQIELPDQQMDLSTIYGEKRPPLSVGHIRSQTVMRGYLLKPGTFEGFSVSSFENLVFHDLRDGGETHFDRGSGSAKFSAAGIVAEDFRAIGDEDAILMNGFATPDGNAAATVRIVSSPERAKSHKRRVENASSELSLDFEPLVTPDREFRDLRLESRSGTLAVDLGKEKQWVPFFPTLRAILGSSENDPPKLP